MAFRDLVPWSRNQQLTPARGDAFEPFFAFHREMNRLFDDVFRSFGTLRTNGSPLMEGHFGWPMVFNRRTGAATQIQMPEKSNMQFFSIGPDGKIWTGGYLSGGSASFNPATGKSEEHKGLSQAESMTTLGESLYFGLYPNGRFATYDTTKPWDTKRDNPKQIGKIEGQK